jgi:hypothetical protein
MSSPVVNFAWGLINLLVGLVLLSNWPVRVGLNGSFLLFLLGVIILGVYASTHFGKVRRNGPN